jgi:uncharacterized membrane protein YgcG
VSSPTGAPTDVKAGVEDGQQVIRIGDEDQTVGGQQTYVIGYTVTGAMNAFPTEAEFYWNVFDGRGWDALVAQPVTAVVRGPAPPTETACFSGPIGSSLSCATDRIGPNAARFTSQPISSEDVFTVVVGYPLSSITVPDPVLREKWSFASAFSVRPVQATVAALALLGGLGLVGWTVWSRGRDRRYIGQVPGLTPAAGQIAVEERVPLGGQNVVVDYAPPPGMRVGEAGTLIDEAADVLDVTATIVDLAVRGYLRIDEVAKKGLIFTKRDWTLVKLKEADADLRRYERTLFEALFQGRDQVALSELKQTFADDLEAVQKQLYGEVVDQGWFRRRPDSTRSNYVFLAFLVVGLGAAATYALARWTSFGLTGLALVIAGLAFLFAARYMPARTGKGSAANAQLLGFREYIRTAEAEQIRFEERADVFSRYLPYAIIFGETERWSKVFASLAAAGGAAGAAGAGGPGVSPALHGLYWYGALGGFDANEFGDALSDFTTATSGSVAAAAPSASSGSSGFGGGGFSGGGFGGGGGGSW